MSEEKKNDDKQILDEAKAPQTAATTSATAAWPPDKVTVSREFWQKLLEIAGRQIDPESAEVTWCCERVLDPYGIYPDLPPEADCAGRLYYARNPGSDIWIEFGDLPDATVNALWNRHDDSSDDDVPF